MLFGARRLSSRHRDYRSYLNLFGLLGIMLIALTGCGFSSPATWVADQFSSSTSAAPNAVPQSPQTQSNHPLAQIKSFSAEENGSLGSLGLNLDDYINDTLDEEDRLTNAEQAILAMHKDLKIMAPSMQNLMLIENDIQALVTKLEAMMKAEPEPPSTGLSPAPASMYSNMANSAPQRIMDKNRPQNVPSVNQARQITQRASGGQALDAIPGSVQVKRLRIGEHNDRTRIVLDVSGPASYHYDLDNAEGLLIIELPEAGWSGQRQWQANGKSPILSSYSVHPMQEKGSRLIMQMKQSTTIVYETTIEKNGYEDYRIVLDLKK